MQASRPVRLRGNGAGGAGVPVAAASGKADSILLRDEDSIACSLFRGSIVRMGQRVKLALEGCELLPLQGNLAS